jgi:Arc/MetJ-type ribon-helix-helix transcriptional regulator
VKNLTPEKNNQSKKYSYKFIQFTVSEEKKKQIEDYSENAGYKTISEFIREAIDEKIIRIDRGQSIDQNDSEVLQKIENLLDIKFLDQNKKLNNILELERLNQEIYNDLSGRFELIQDHVDKEKYKDITDKIYDFIKNQKGATQKEVMSQFALDPHESVKILSNKTKFEYDIATSRFNAK